MRDIPTKMIRQTLCKKKRYVENKNGSKII